MTIPSENFIQWDPQKERPCVKTRILSHHALFYDSPFGLGVSLRKLVKNVNFYRYISPMSPLKAAWRIGMELLVSVEDNE
jgi:hypothetical protein